MINIVYWVVVALAIWGSPLLFLGWPVWTAPEMPYDGRD